MLHHESYRSDTAPRITLASDLRPVSQPQHVSESTPLAEANALLRGIASEDLSPNKAAVVRQLLALWLQDTRSRQA